MRKKLFASIVFLLAILLSSCSVSYDACIINKSDETLEIKVIYEKQGSIEPAGFMEILDWENNQKILSRLLLGITQWKPLPQENYQTNVEKLERIIKLQPNQVLRLDGIRHKPDQNDGYSVGNVERLDLKGQNGEISFTGNNFYIQFEDFNSGIFFTYK